MSERIPATPAVDILRSAEVDYTTHLFDYGTHPGAMGAAEALGVEPSCTAKTIVFTTSEHRGVIVVMHGDREVSTKKLASTLGVKSVRPSSIDEAKAWTGYVFGGTSPLGLRKSLPVMIESSLLDLERVYVNAGRRGFLVGLDPSDLARLCEGVPVEVAR